MDWKPISGFGQVACTEEPITLISARNISKMNGARTKVILRQDLQFSEEAELLKVLNFLRRTDARTPVSKIDVLDMSAKESTAGTQRNECQSKSTAFKRSLSACPPTTPLSTIISLIILLVLLYGTLWGFMPDIAIPGGPVFALFILLITCYLGGQLVRNIKLPSLVGMMIVGFGLRNIPYVSIANDIPETWASNIRNLALVLILLRAGLEVDSDVLRNNTGTCVGLILIPFIIECLTGAIVSHFLLTLPWLYSFLMGFMLSAVSPAVVLPVMLKLQKKGIGITNGIPTLVIAVAGIDDVLALTGFEIILGITFATGSLSWNIGKGVIEVVIGVVYGVLLGFVCWYIPNPFEKSKNIFRVIILGVGGTCIMFASQELKYGGAGALGCICLPFVAAIRWKTQDWDEDDNPISDSLAFVWRIIEPFLFGLIGSEIRIDNLHPEIVGIGIAILVIGLALRMLGSLIAAHGAGMTIREQIFVTFAGLPKATVQAAIGPVAFTIAVENNMSQEFRDYGTQIVTVAVLSILITAPIGATAIAFLAPRLLEVETVDVPNTNEVKDRNSIVPNGEETRVNVFELDSNVYTIARL